MFGVQKPGGHIVCDMAVCTVGGVWGGYLLENIHWKYFQIQ